MSEFLLPDLGEGLAEAEIVEWHVGAGDHVVTGQPLLSVETDKSIVEIPSPRGGTAPGRRPRERGLLPEPWVLGDPFDFGQGGRAARGGRRDQVPAHPGHRPLRLQPVRTII